MAINAIEKIRQGTRTTPVPLGVEASLIICRLAELWDEISSKAGAPKADFIWKIFDDIFHNGPDGPSQERIIDQWDEQPEHLKPFAILQAGLVSCSYAADAMKAQLEDSDDIARAWRALSKAEYWLGITVGSWSVRSTQQPSIAEFSRKGADERHAENRAMKQLVFHWCDAHMHAFRSMDAAAETLAGKVVPVKFRTARQWVGEWKKLRSAGKP